MSFSGHHIPFPRAFLSLNPTPSKSGHVHAVVASTATDAELSAHGFLSNRAAAVGRHDSISSVSSVDSLASASSASPSTQYASVPDVAPPSAAFLALNTQHEALAASAEEVAAARFAWGGFLSNRG